MEVLPSSVSCFRWSIRVEWTAVLPQDPVEKMRQDHPEGHRKRLPGDHVDAVAVNGPGDPLPHRELVENQAVELAFVLQGIDDDALL